MTLGTPKAPSALIRISRWTFLITGIMYGHRRQTVLAIKETELRRIEELNRPAREEAMKAEKKRLNLEEMAYLAKETGISTGMDDSNSKRQSPCGCKY